MAIKSGFDEAYSGMLAKNEGIDTLEVVLTYSPGRVRAAVRRYSAAEKKRLNAMGYRAIPRHKEPIYVCSSGPLGRTLVKYYPIDKNIEKTRGYMIVIHKIMLCLGYDARVDFTFDDPTRFGLPDVLYCRGIGDLFRLYPKQTTEGLFDGMGGLYDDMSGTPEHIPILHHQ